MATTSFPLTRLPGELQDAVWAAALPSHPNIFHVAKAVRSRDRPKTAQLLIFHNRIPPPPVLQACTRSRAAARVAGFITFAQPGDDAPGIWFNTRVDILYFGGSMSLFGAIFRRFAGDPPPLFTDVPELRLVRHIGIPPGRTGGRYHVVPGGVQFTATVTYGAPGADVTLPRALRELVRVLGKRAPAVTTINYILPMIQAETWGPEEPWCEPAGYLSHPISLAPIRPRDIVVRHARRQREINWGEVEPVFLAALEALGPDAPRLEGWYLKRVHPTAICSEDIRRLRVE